MLLLHDALNRVLAEPQCAGLWHRLLEIWTETTQESARQSVLQVLAAMPEAEPRADILRLTFLAGVTRESRFEYAAAGRLLAMRPIDPDRLAAFASYLWLTALQYRQGRADFIAALCAARVPQMASRLAQYAMGLLPASFLPRAPEHIERVAVVLPYVGNQFHTPSVMAVEQCAALEREGRQVHIFSAQELVPPELTLYRGDGGTLILPPLDLQAWSRALPAGMAMTLSDSRFSLPGRWRNMMPVLADFDPDALLMVGLYSPLAAALHAVRPVVGISVHTVPPIAPVDVWLSADPAAENAHAWGGVFPPPQAVYHPQRIRRSRKRWRLARTDIGLSDAAVIWVTAGFRLAHEVRGEWAARMLELLSRHARAYWILVGGEGELPQSLRASGKVRALATRADLIGVLRLCDIYVNPPRMGGGFSVAEAMAEALPVTAFAGSDGGDKVGDLAVADMNAYMDRLAALSESPELRAQMGRALRRRFVECFDVEASGPALVAAFGQAASLARSRFRSAGA